MIEELYASELGHMLLTIGMAMLPIVELRGAIPFGVSLGFSIKTACFLSIIGNFIPVPFIIYLIRRIFSFMRKYSPFNYAIDRLETKAHLKGEKVKKYRALGLCLLVAIPLPGTGAWTGALVAGVLEMRLRDAIGPIIIGIVIAGLLVSLATSGVIAIAF